MDLFVRVSNKIAINMYKNLGYIVYRTVIDYYAGYDNADEDAYGKYECKRISKTRFKTHFNLKSFI